MHAGDNFCVRELPDVNMMAADDSRKLFNILADFRDTDIFRGGLEQDA